ncbi:MAG: AmmeMemoRadiSam system protein B, partial [Thermoanaerobaculia bacterium]
GDHRVAKAEQLPGGAVDLIDLLLEGDAERRSDIGGEPQELWRVVDEYDVSMCGFIPTTTMLLAANALGATEARLIKHATSGDVNGDYSHVVGYAALLIS